MTDVLHFVACALAAGIGVMCGAWLAEKTWHWWL
jgi:hypothetical protein